MTDEKATAILSDPTTGARDVVSAMRHFWKKGSWPPELHDNFLLSVTGGLFSADGEPNEDAISALIAKHEQQPSD